MARITVELSDGTVASCVVSEMARAVVNASERIVWTRHAQGVEAAFLREVNAGLAECLAKLHAQLGQGAKPQSAMCAMAMLDERSGELSRAAHLYVVPAARQVFSLCLDQMANGIATIVDKASEQFPRAQKVDA